MRNEFADMAARIVGIQPLNPTDSEFGPDDAEILAMDIYQSIQRLAGRKDFQKRRDILNLLNEAKDNLEDVIATMWP